MLALTFYLCAIVIVVAAFMVVISRNPVHSVLWLILTFLSSVAIFVLLGAEFLAMLLMVVYVGAVAVLFLFVVMMLDVDFASLKEGALKNLGFGLIVAAILGAELFLVTSQAGNAEISASMPLDGHSNTHALGIAIFEVYPFVFLGAGMILLVAMIGAIVLTMRHRKDVKRQNVMVQMSRDPAKAMELVDVKPGQGL